MLSVYTRHYPPCLQADINYRRCRCPTLINRTLPNGKFVRQAAKTRSWETAERKARLMEAQADPLENAFVLRAAPSSDFETGKLEGRMLHVESGRELEFRSVKEMVMFVSECMTHNRGKGPGR